MNDKDLNVCNKALRELGIEPINDFNNKVGEILLQAPDFINHYRLALYLMPWFGIFNDQIKIYLEKRIKGV